MAKPSQRPREEAACAPHRIPTCPWQRVFSRPSAWSSDRRECEPSWSPCCDLAEIHCISAAGLSRGEGYSGPAMARGRKPPGNWEWMRCPRVRFRLRLAERGGFEPPVELLTLRRFSKPLLSTTQPPLRERAIGRASKIIAQPDWRAPRGELSNTR